ncbi:MAG: flagellar biosynthetic protein FliP, partial [Proteobacteria bacterium]|nr:flagellar biosynthetic protein FliP [Pseudomonadota bacterium]
MRTLVSVIAMALLLVPDWAWAQASIPLITTQPTANGGADYSLSLQILLLMSLLTLLPAALITMTSFTRILIVLAILRQALGTTTTPSNQIILGLALFLSLFIMAPVFDVAYNAALMPYMSEQIGFEAALNAAKEPFREFMFAQTRATDLALFSDLGNYGPFVSQE